MGKLHFITLLLSGFVAGTCMAETYTAPNISVKKAGPMQSGTVTLGESWNKGMEYRVLEMPIIVREIASEKEKESEETSRDPASVDGRDQQIYKFIPGPWYYTKE